MTRDDLATQYIESLPYTPYPLQEEALLTWFTSEQGVLVCAPTGTGKTLIAQAALYEALHSDTVAYYTTPLIALTEQKFQEMRAAVQQWGFSPEQVGLVTGNRRVNPDAKILVVVAEILLNRLLNAEAFDWSQVSAVVMDEFHSFADVERGIVWELSLSLLPKHVRLMLLSATVGNSAEFMNWLEVCHGRKLELVEGTERKVPLTYQYVPSEFLGEHIEHMVKGDESERKTPALIFCFNRDECWSVAEQLKGMNVLPSGIKEPLIKELEALDWTQGVGPKLKQMLRRGVGVHHAGLLPKYRRVVEDLFEKKLLSVAVCTETLAAGINLPARSVVLSALMKGPFGAEKLIDPSTAHQIFGRAGRPQFDKEGFVYAIAHEDDVRILRWQEKFDQIPEDTKDPVLLKKKKELKRKKPTRNQNRKYWTETHFEQLRDAPPARLYSKGPLPWRLLGYLLEVSPEVDRVRTVIRKRLMDQPRIDAGEKALHRMLLVLGDLGYVTLDPAPPPPPAEGQEAASIESYKIELATPTPKLARMMAFRSIHPLYGAYLADMLGDASPIERIQALESVLEMPRPLLKFVRVPFELPTGPLTERLDPELITRGLIRAPIVEEEEDDDDGWMKDRERPTLLGEKLLLYFDAFYPDVGDVNVCPVWAAGELLDIGGDFNTYVRNRDLTRQEGIIFRHLLRLILLCGEFMEVTPPDLSHEEWREIMSEIADRLTETCRQVDPTSTEQVIKQAHAADVAEGEEHAKTVTVTAEPPKGDDTDSPDDFGEGILEAE